MMSLKLPPLSSSYPSKEKQGPKLIKSNEGEEQRPYFMEDLDDVDRESGRFSL